MPKQVERSPDEWVSGGEPMTEAQASFLKRLSEDAGEPFDGTLSKAAASKRIDELRKGGPVKRTKRTAAAKRPESTGGNGMSEAQSAYLQELAEEEGEEFNADLTKEEGARRIGELLVKQMARSSPTEPPF